MTKLLYYVDYFKMFMYTVRKYSGWLGNVANRKADVMCL